ncbi:MAG: AAA family ATPase [Actinomycetota bacterium]|nr:AAA family ATPase [Actinomycetota bacterium]MDH5332948.1 AAA family ATPase [Thermoleophilia bacterium]
MIACPSCGHENPDGAKFCMECATPLSAPARPALAEERKVVTCLFCDLVGFTQASESADPEDIRRMLDSYFALVRAQIEAHGGVVEKFIGDAAVGVFGVPATHEDDPERAVRAALRITEEAAKLTGLAGAPLRLRVGINTGEALVRLGVEPSSGEGFLTGDAVNTAARLQSAAPQMRVAVGRSTYEATAMLFEYEELPPAAVKGKAEPVRVFVPKATRGRLGADLIRTSDTPYVGRKTDLALLEGLFGTTVATSSVQLVTVVGEPGIGKSRIVAELLARAQAQTPGLTWRQGRCLTYGDGVTFWALGEIVKAHAGILETDDPEAASAKLHEIVPTGVDREWMTQRLLPLVGVDVSSQAKREELFTAWRRFLESVAEHSPTVLVFEDLHWADDAMLAFLEHLADRAEDVPLLVVGTARPELFERHASFASGLPNVHRINLMPLSDEETARLVSSLIDTSELPGELREPIIERSEGNPLYTEEFVRLLQDRGLLVRQEGSWKLRAGAEVPLPDSIHALIAARLDTLSSERKSMLADAAVVGKVFWAGAVAEMGDRDLTDVVDAMRELSRLELVRPAERSSMQGETEYAFWHVLTRDVAYNRLPRPSRATRHVAAASWLEGKASGRVEDIAEVLAYHYATALELARAAGQSGQATELEAPALRSLTLAGEKGLNLDVEAARVSLRRALELAPEGHPARARLLTLLAEAERASGHLTDAVGLFEEAAAAHVAAGDQAAADRSTLSLALELWNAGDFERARSLVDELLVRLEGDEPSELLARVYSAKQLSNQDDLTWTEKALVIADRLDLPSVRSRALGQRGNARANFGDLGGIDDLRASLVLSLELQSTYEAYVTYVNLVEALCAVDPAVAIEVADEGIAFERARGLSPRAKARKLWALLPLGRWDELLAAGRELVSAAESLGDRWLAAHAPAPVALVLTRRGETVEAADLIRASSSEAVEGAFSVPAIVAHRTRCELEDAERLLEDTVRTRSSRYTVVAWNYDYCDLAREAAAFRRLDLLDTLLLMPAGGQAAGRHTKTTWGAIAAEAAGHPREALAFYEDADEGWRQFGDPYERAHSLLGQGRCLSRLGRAGKAEQPLSAARELFAQLGAVAALTETDLLLLESSALSS